MENWLSSYGYLEFNNNALRLKLCDDISKYYKQFIDKEFKIFSHLPLHGAHVTIMSKKIHSNWNVHKINNVVSFHRKEKIKFDYNVNIRVGGQTKGFMNFIINIRSKTLDKISDYLEIDQNFHLTVSNTKQSVRPYIWMK